MEFNQPLNETLVNNHYFTSNYREYNLGNGNFRVTVNCPFSYYKNGFWRFRPVNVSFEKLGTLPINVLSYNTTYDIFDFSEGHFAEYRTFYTGTYQYYGYGIISGYYFTLNTSSTAGTRGIYILINDSIRISTFSTTSTSSNYIIYSGYLSDSTYGYIRPLFLIPAKSYKISANLQSGDTFTINSIYIDYYFTKLHTFYIKGENLKIRLPFFLFTNDNYEIENEKIYYPYLSWERLD